MTLAGVAGGVAIWLCETSYKTWAVWISLLGHFATYSRDKVDPLILKDAQSEAHFLWEKQMTEVSSSCGNDVPEIPATSRYKIETQKWTPEKKEYYICIYLHSILAHHMFIIFNLDMFLLDSPRQPSSARATGGLWLYSRAWPFGLIGWMPTELPSWFGILKWQDKDII